MDNLVQLTCFSPAALTENPLNLKVSTVILYCNKGCSTSNTSYLKDIHMPLHSKQEVIYMNLITQSNLTCQVTCCYVTYLISIIIGFVSQERNLFGTFYILER